MFQIEEVKNSNERKLQTQQLMRGKAWENMLDRVVSKTGVKMNVSEVELLWNMCRFERPKCPWCQYPSWCSVFTNEDLEIWQFSEDFAAYYTYGPGSKDIARHITQPLFADMFSNFDKVVTDKSSKKSSLLNFGHDATVQSFLNALGLFTDDHD